MKKNITYLCMAAAALLVSSCTQNEEITPTIENEGRVPVLFTAKNIVTLETKADGYWYSSNDMGISMLSADGENLIETNVHFRPENSGEGEVSLIPSTDGYTLYYPTDGSNVQFNAYVPYRTASSGIVTWDFSTETIRPFYTATTKGDGQEYNETTGQTQSVKFAFKHCLAQIVINLESTDYVVSNGVSATLSNLPAFFTYNIATNEITPSTDPSDIPAFVNGSQLSFNVLPETWTEGSRTITFVLPEGSTFEATLSCPEGGFIAGKQYTYKTTFTETKTEGTFKATIEAWEVQDMGALTPTEVPVEP